MAAVEGLEIDDDTAFCVVVARFVGRIVRCRFQLDVHGCRPPYSTIRSTLFEGSKLVRRILKIEI